jgi:hypothetical protein
MSNGIFFKRKYNWIFKTSRKNACKNNLTIFFIENLVNKLL